MKNLALLSLLCLLWRVAATQPEPDRPVACYEKEHRPFQPAPSQRVEYFQYPSMNKYDVRYLKLDISVLPNNRNISGSCLTRAIVTAPLDSFICELRAGITVDSVFINNVKTATFSQGNDHVFVRINPTLPAGTTINAQFFYHGLTSALGVYAGTITSNGLQYTATLSESYQAREWFPVKQQLKDKIDSADIWLTTDAAYLAGSNGLLVNTVDLPGGKKQYQWKTRYKMNYYMPSFSVGNYLDYRNYAKPAAIAPDSILVQHYIVNNSAYLNSIKANLDKTPAFIEKLSDLYGIYPWYKEKYGHCYANIGGGMEHQTMSTMSTFDPTIIAHELGHQWFGDEVTCATWNHIWVNEGFAAYTEYLMIEQLPALFPGYTPAAYMNSIHNNVMSQPNGSVFVPETSVFDENRIFSSRLTYDKGSVIIHTLRFEMQDDAKFFQTLRTYLQQFKDSVATADDFRQVAESVCGRSFADFFNQWYYGEGYPTFNVDYSRQGDSLALYINQIVSAPSVTPFFKGLYEFTIKTNQGDTTVKINLTANNQLFKFRSNRIPTGVVVDPNNWVLNKTGSITTPVTDPGTVITDIRLFPNPNAGSFQVEFPANKFSRLLILDATGRMILQRTIAAATNSESISASLPAGTYLLWLQNGQSGTTRIFTVR